jgi:hypothetical protein
MHVTAETLTNLAKDHIARRLRGSNDIAAVYLTGSVLTDEPLLGGTTDIDLVFVHREEPPVGREVLRVSFEISLDIEHHHQSFYAFPRRLRQNPWLGFALCNKRSSLYDPDHWLDYLQAGVSAQFTAPETFYARARLLSEKARQSWFDLQENTEQPTQGWMALYLKTVGLAANSVAALSGPALTIRRFLLDFPKRAEAVDRLSMAGDLARLLGNDSFSLELYQTWRPAWEEALAAASQQPDCPPNLARPRKAYFLSSCDALAESGNTFATLWPLLETWRQSVAFLPEEPVYLETWRGVLEDLGFTRDSAEGLTSQLDGFIEQGELLLENWKSTYGL